MSRRFGFVGRSMRTLIINFSLVVTSTILALILCESGYRLWKGVPVFQAIDSLQPVESRRSVGCGSKFDPELGWKPAAFTDGVNSNGGQVSILSTGIRSNGQEKALGSSTVVAVGDSYTFGDQVSNDQSWPAALERRLNTPVLNGGVCGYGIGQTVRRAEILIAQFRPDILIVGMIPTDIDRTRASRFYGRPKPYFALEHGQLIYRHEHLSDTLANTASWSQEKLADHSLTQAVTDVLDRYSLLWRALPDVPHVIGQLQSRIALIRGTAHTYISRDGVEISCRLLSRIKSFEQKFDLTAFLLVQYKLRDILNRMQLEEGQASQSSSTDMEIVANTVNLISCADEIELSVIDTFAPLRDIYLTGGRSKLVALYGDHMSPQGNQLVADLIAEDLSQAQDQ